MKVKYLILFLIVFLLFFTLIGCVSTPPPLEDYFKPYIEGQTRYFVPEGGSSIVHPNPTLAKYELREIAGSIFIMGYNIEGKKVIIRKRQYLEGSQIPKVEILENEILLSEKIDTTFQTNVSVLEKIKGNIDSDQKIDVVFETIGIAIISDNMIPWDTLTTLAIEASEKSKSKDFIDYYYVRTVTINRATTKKFSKLKTDQIIDGTAFRIGNDIYHSNESNQINYEVILDGFPLIPVLGSEKPKEVKVPKEFKKHEDFSQEIGETLILPDLWQPENLKTEEFQAYTNLITDPNLFQGLIKANPYLKNKFLELPHSFVTINDESELSFEFRQLLESKPPF